MYGDLLSIKLFLYSGNTFLKKLRVLVGEYNKVIWCYQLS